MLISVVSLVGVVAIPSYLSYRTNAQATCIAKQFRSFASAFHHYLDVHGSWPADQAVGRIPRGMEMNVPEFDDRTDIGGYWDWEHEEGTGFAAICLVEPESSNIVIERIDQILDDGNLSSGALVMQGRRLVLNLQP